MRFRVEAVKRTGKKAWVFYLFVRFLSRPALVERLCVCERRARSESTKRLVQVVQAFHVVLARTVDTASLQAKSSTQQQPHLFTAVRRDRAAFAALSGRVRPVVIMPYVSCPVNRKGRTCTSL